MTCLKGQFLTPDGFLLGTVTVAPQGRIAAVEGVPQSEAQARSSGLPLYLPGFIDTHVHGGGGADTMEGGEAVRQLARTHARHGTTSLLATTMTAPLDDIRAALQALAPACATRGAQEARVLGVHLEGPYISPGRLGAQPDYVKPLALSELLALHALAPIRLITLAPELPGHLAVIPDLVAQGMRVQIGHSNGGYEDGVAALQAGAHGFTHLFNAMSALHHREPGMVGAALAHADHAELIPDLIHVHPGAIRTALRAIPRLFCVTDSTSASGMPDGEYRLGRHTVTKCLGGVRLADGTLAGSTLTMDQALRNLVNALGLSLADASRRCSTYAADYLGLNDRGRIAVGAHADVVELNADLRLQATYVEGERIECHAG
ncbi:N-acetylglucosamine-6-phosphate deacetylase [Inhella gelatinilytica]|uniref:N-acetylglucosamine-6-phosphate deacetylase n=1 Tax=Inhella gelatinilytica TaxID=2795030 RepID=A0A931NEH6_9BURK|nr:N-acetylglucosamine-6-phosphate deacetylase [Inhella gelatinilytica]MBH9553699.1 N-acetylglucosamine-6-phosphate deacetylase [Inhella gelatinilytica]